MIHRVAAIALLLFAGGCATLPPPPADDWASRRAALQALEDWTLEGRIAVAAGEDGFSGGFDWAQQGARADIALSGPMGGKGLEIHLDDGELTVDLRGEAYAGDEARQLIEERIGPGHALPVGEMRYWLVGAPAPGVPHEETLGEDRRLAGLAQAGWQVRYQRYDVVGPLALPARLEMTTEGLRLRVSVSHWQLPP